MSPCTVCGYAHDEPEFAPREPRCMKVLCRRCKSVGNLYGRPRGEFVCGECDTLQPVAGALVLAEVEL
jgi:hypothetical protein